MGFEAPGTGTRLDFTGTAYEGLEVTVGSVPLGLMLDITNQYDDAKSAMAGGDVKGAMPVIETLVTQFAEVLEDWNVTRKGEPVAATLEGLRSLDAMFAMAVIGAWVEGTVSAPPPLQQSSPSGTTSQAEREAMAAMSSSLPS